MNFIKHWFSVLFCIFLGAFFYVISNSSMTTNINRDSFLYPKTVSIIFIILTVMLAIQVFKSKEKSDFSISWIGIASIFSYVTVMYILGFFLATIVFLGFSLYYLGERNWKKIVVLNGSITLAIYTVFQFIFNVPIPGGIIW